MFAVAATFSHTHTENCGQFNDFNNCHCNEFQILSVAALVNILAIRDTQKC